MQRIPWPLIGEHETVLCRMRCSGALVHKPQPKGLTPSPNCIFIVSRNRVLREALAQILGAKRRASIRVASCLYSDTVQSILSYRTQVLLLDAAALSLESRERMREIRAAVPGLKIVLINIRENEGVFREAARLEVDGYLLHDAAVPEIVAALRGVMNGAIVCPPHFLRTLFCWRRKQKI